MNNLIHELHMAGLSDLAMYLTTYLQFATPQQVMALQNAITRYYNKDLRS